MNLKEPIRKLAGLITRIDDETRQPSGAGETKTYEINSDFVSFWKEGLGGLTLTDESAKEYRQCVDAIYKQVAGKAEHISRSAVESFIQSAMLRAIDPVETAVEKDFSKRLASVLSEIARELNTKPSVWEVHFPVQGVVADSLPFAFGLCEFYFGDEAFIGRLLERVDRVIIALVGDAAVHESRRDAEERIRKLVSGKAGVAVRVEAVDAEAARLLAQRIARQGVDILNFYANLGQRPRSEVLLFAEGRGPGVLYTFLFAEQPPAFQTPAVRFGPIAPFSFAATHLADTGFARMSEILKMRDRSKFEDRLVSAFQWAGRASIEPRKEEAFLLFAISLESLLMERGDKSEITETLSLRAAHVIAAPQSRLTVYRDMKKLYRIRSAIVHSGSVDVGDDQLSEIRYYARLALLTMMCTPRFSRITNDDELTEWFRARLLDTP